MGKLIKQLSLLSSFFGMSHVVDDEDSPRLKQLKASLNPENNMRVYYQNIVGYFNSTTEKVKKERGIR